VIGHANFLTKERHFGERTKAVLLLVAICIVLFGCFYPTVIAFFEWSAHRQDTFHGRVIHLPMFWTQGETGPGSWDRPPKHAFTQFGNSLNTFPIPKSWGEAQNLEAWHRVYGVSELDDMNKFPDLRTLVEEGMTCGSVKYGHLERKPDGQMAVGCLAKDRKVTFEYSGSEAGLRAAASIIQQAK